MATSNIREETKYWERVQVSSISRWTNKSYHGMKWVMHNHISHATFSNEMSVLSTDTNCASCMQPSTNYLQMYKGNLLFILVSLKRTPQLHYDSHTSYASHQLAVGAPTVEPPEWKFGGARWEAPLRLLLSFSTATHACTTENLVNQWS